MDRTNTLLCFLALIALLTTTGCAGVTYHAASFTPVLPESEIAPLDGEDFNARFTPNFDAENQRMAERGYELVGFAKFTSALQPRYAEWNAGLAAKKYGATEVLLKPAERARMNQNSYVTTFWRRIPPERFVLGAIYDDLEPNLLGSVGCTNNVVVLASILPDSAAERMGLAVADAIIFVDDTRITDARALDEVLGDKAGEKVTIGFVRNGEREQVTGRLAGVKGRRPEVARTGSTGVRLARGRLDGQLAKAAERGEGVFIDGVGYGSPACEAGLRTGDLVLAVGGEPVEDEAELRSALRDKIGSEVSLTLVRGLRRIELPLDLAGGATGTRARLAVAERSPGRPWEGVTGTDWTWATVTAQVITAASQQYVAYVEEERRRIAEYNRRQAAAAAAAPSNRAIGLEGGARSARSRRTSAGGPRILTAGGDYVSVDYDTARMFQENPGYYAVSSGRRGVQIYDRYDNPVTRPRPAGGLQPLRFGLEPSLQNISFPDSLQLYFQQAPPSANYGQEWSGYGQYYSTDKMEERGDNCGTYGWKNKNNC